MGRGGGRLGRSASGSSSSGKSAYSRVASEMITSVGLGRMEIDMETLLEDVAAGASQGEESRGASPARSKSTRSQRSLDADGNGSGNEGATKATGKLTGVLGAHRRSTVSSREPRSPKLTARVRASTARSADVKEGGVIKERVCLKCRTKIEDGRWINVDSGNGGVLCEDCWKNMYLPKVSSCILLSFVWLLTRNEIVSSV